MNAEHAWNCPLDRSVHRPDRSIDRFEIVADERRQEPGGAEAAVGFADRCNSLDGWMIVEQDAAAAVHLQVDEAGDQVSFQFCALQSGWARARWHHACDPSSLHDHAAVRTESVRCQHA